MRLIFTVFTASAVLFAQPRVTSPPKGEVYVLEANSSGVSDFVAHIPIQASSTENKSLDLRWEASMMYQTRGTKSVNGGGDVAYTNPGQRETITFKNAGGRLNFSVGQYGTFSGPATFSEYVAVFDTRPIRSEILSVAKGEYIETAGYQALLAMKSALIGPSGAALVLAPDADLAGCIAAPESGFRQFASFKHPTYGVTAWWPNDNSAAPGGKGGYVGLLQVETTMASAFNWTTNVQAGVKILSGKIESTLRYIANRRAENHKLPPLDIPQIEDIHRLL